LPRRDIRFGDFHSSDSGLIGQYVQGNEPSHHIIYLFTLADAPHKTAELVREVFDRFYMNKPDGLCGNDDCGQMSAWYMFSALGFYPVNPASGDYVLGAPQIKNATLNLAGGKTFTIKANNLSKENKYVKAVRLNGKDISGSKTISYAQIMAGGILEFDMESRQ
jgi:predicted alpha-1,2-mannosidase